MQRPQIGLAHKACDAMLTARLSRLTQVEEDYPRSGFWGQVTLGR